VLDIVAPAGLWPFFVECGAPAPELRAPDQTQIPPDLPEIVARYDGAVLARRSPSGSATESSGSYSAS
jgi:hypothetical protein